MSEVNPINKIYVKSSININRVDMTTLLFIDNLAVSKTRYSLLNKYINVLESSSESLSLYHNVNSCDYYEYQLNLQQNNITVSGFDRFGHKLQDLDKKNVIVFVNGYKLLNNEFQIASKNSIIIFPKFVSERISTVIIYASEKLSYCGRVFDESSWDPETCEFILEDYTETRYIFFKNGEQVNYDNITKLKKYVKLDFLFEKTDIIEYYELPNDTSVCMFTGMPGYLSYGPIDKHRKEVPILYDAIVLFETPARLIIDDVREGFFLKEEDGTGSLMFINNDFDSREIKAIILTEFSKTFYKYDEYFIQVPETTSILKYASEFDLNGKLFPELLGIFQRVLLDETYDSLQRLKNIRNINKVDTQHLSALINFLGLNIKINNITSEQKRRLLDELNHFYDIVGTEASYNFYNFLTEGSSLVKLEQLFTPIKDNNDKANPLKRYVDFRRPVDFEEDYSYHKEYKIPTTDYGSVEEIASDTDILTNMPRNRGTLENPNVLISDNVDWYGYTPEGIREVYVTDNEGNTNINYLYTDPNNYTTLPLPGPNKAVIDYGWITDEATDFIDYGSVEDKIKGEWIEWYEWNRNPLWYPTNHVTASITIPIDVDYGDFIKQFMNIFYKIASTVVYLHNVIQVFSFGPTNSLKNEANSKISLMTSPLYNQQEYTFMSDPLRQPDKHWQTKVDPSWTVTPWVDTIYDPVNRKWLDATYPPITTTDANVLRSKLNLFKNNKALQVKVTGIFNTGEIDTAEIINYFGIVDLTDTDKISIINIDSEGNENRAIFEFRCTKVVTGTGTAPSIYKYEILSVLNRGNKFIVDERYTASACKQEFKLHNSFDRCGEVVFHDVDYVIFGYTHIPGHGHHLDTFTRIVNSKNPNYNIAVGHYTSDYAKIPYSSQRIGSYNSEMDYDPNALVQWCRHNQGYDEGSPKFYTTENVIINVDNFKNELYRDAFDDIIIFDLYCAFLGNVNGVTSPNDVTITIRGYKGGNIVKYLYGEHQHHTDNYPKYDPYQFHNVDDEGNDRDTKYYQELPLENIYISGTINQTISYTAIPENISGTVSQRLRKVARIKYQQSNKKITFEIIPNQGS
ncbi:MAG: hypothetical protein IKO49_01990 [Bacilli bacterium]|nr:hypothetical protein [Clostridia bacterium]MBR4618051.1 hypothetical protein [Bacilli bacterium]